MDAPLSWVKVFAQNGAERYNLLDFAWVGLAGRQIFNIAKYPGFVSFFILSRGWPSAEVAFLQLSGRGFAGAIIYPESLSQRGFTVRPEDMR
jgi:hypothetical protein